MNFLSRITAGYGKRPGSRKTWISDQNYRGSLRKFRRGKKLNQREIIWFWRV
jgi:hypothetical protein